MPEIRDYNNVDYREFWKGKNRLYLNQIEQLLISRLYPPSCDTFVDIGCGFGRLAPHYLKLTKRAFLVDYSLDQLRQTRKQYGDHPSAAAFVMADLAQLPFRDGMFDVAQSIRVLHHVKDLDSAFREFHRILAPSAMLLVTYANKRNLLELLRWVLRRPNKQPWAHTRTTVGELQFMSHPDYFEGIMDAHRLSIDRRYGVGYFDHEKVIQFVPAPVAIERVTSHVFGPTRLAPLMLVRARNLKTGPPPRETGGDEPVSPFVCPKCKGGLQEPGETEMYCATCRKAYSILDGIHDFRT